ncbi:MAG: MBL fold metallo-hydrolase [Fusobacteriaceae bacterium]
MKKIILVLCVILESIFSYGKSFEIITLGSDGGVNDGNLSSYLLKGAQDSNYVALDAGTLLPGIKKNLEKNNFTSINIPKDIEWSKEGYIFREKIKGYFLSHAHLDHISGLVISSTEDTKKPIYGIKSTIEKLKDTVFNWKLWPNFANEGEGYKLGQYEYVVLDIGKEKEVVGTTLKVKAFPLSHSNYESTMFLFNSNGDYLAYYGDVGADRVEKSNLLEKTFVEIAPLIKSEKLKAIMIEVSYVNGKKEKDLFGHLTPNLLNEEIENLAKYTGKEKLKNLDIVIIHIKPSLKNNDDVREKIKNELEKSNKYKINYFFPIQGDKMFF